MLTTESSTCNFHAGKVGGSSRWSSETVPLSGERVRCSLTTNKLYLRALSGDVGVMRVEKHIQYRIRGPACMLY